MWFSLNEASLGLFKFISNYLPYFEKMNIFFNIITKKLELIDKDWSKLFVRFIRNNLNQVVHTLTRVTRCGQPDWGYFFMNRTNVDVCGDFTSVDPAQVLLFLAGSLQATYFPCWCRWSINNICLRRIVWKAIDECLIVWIEWLR